MSDTFNIVVGDWSHDGHGHTRTHLVNTALTYQDVEQAWDAVNDKLDEKYGFSFHEVCQDYENNLLTKDQSDAFIDMGINLADICDSADDYLYDDDDSDAEFALDSDSFVKLVITLLNQHNPQLMLHRTTNSNRKELHIGGYGLFSD
jgi:hypothetical protein